MVLSTNELRKLALRELKDVGLRQVYLGVESGASAQLRRMRKGVTPEGNQMALRVLRSLDLQAACGWIMFDPFLESAGDLLENIEFIERNDLIPNSLDDTFVTNPINTMKVLVGTPLKDQVEKAGLLRGLMTNLLEYDFVYQSPVIGTLVDEVLAWQAGYDQARIYALKNWVAHAALSRSPLDHCGYQLFFDLKRIDFEVSKWLIEQLHAAELRNQRERSFTVPQEFHDRRSAMLAYVPAVVADDLSTAWPSPKS